MVEDGNASPCPDFGCQLTSVKFDMKTKSKEVLLDRD